MPSQGEEKYQQYYLSASANNDGAGTEHIVQELDNEGQISSIKIFGPDVQDYSIKVREHNGAAEVVKFKMAGNSNYNVGEFDDPVFEFGAVKEIVVVNNTALSADDYGINIRIDELTG